MKAALAHWTVAVPAASALLLGAALYLPPNPVLTVEGSQLGEAPGAFGPGEHAVQAALLHHFASAKRPWLTGASGSGYHILRQGGWPKTLAAENACG